mmetsp:Transcript_148695/g.476192  ORF Transcript_148695/g.476192 Transcript_148695/m.476192 type:complete len:214 (-) Transcript_148695:45-686(-)
MDQSSRRCRRWSSLAGRRHCHDLATLGRLRCCQCGRYRSDRHGLVDEFGSQARPQLVKLRVCGLHLGSIRLPPRTSPLVFGPKPPPSRKLANGLLGWHFLFLGNLLGTLLLLTSHLLLGDLLGTIRLLRNSFLPGLLGRSLLLRSHLFLGDVLGRLLLLRNRLLLGDLQGRRIFLQGLLSLGGFFSPWRSPSPWQPPCLWEAPWPAPSPWEFP